MVGKLPPHLVSSTCSQSIHPFYPSSCVVAGGLVWKGSIHSFKLLFSPNGLTFSVLDAFLFGLKTYGPFFLLPVLFQLRRRSKSGLSRKLSKSILSAIRSSSKIICFYFFTMILIWFELALKSYIGNDGRIEFASLLFDSKNLWQVSSLQHLLRFDFENWFFIHLILFFFFVAGFISSGISLLIEAPSRREELVTYVVFNQTPEVSFEEVFINPK